MIRVSQSFFGPRNLWQGEIFSLNSLAQVLVFAEPIANPTNYFHWFQTLGYIIVYCNGYLSMVSKQISLISCQFILNIIQIFEYSKHILKIFAEPLKPHLRNTGVDNP